MLRIIQNRSAAGAKSYYARGDYYAEGHEAAGRWGGIGAERLGLEGTVQQEAFEHLCDNRNPLRPDENLTPRTKSDRTVGYDFNFHCPKSVSLYHALTDDDRILDAFRTAVDATMRELEAEMKTRVRKGGRDDERTTGNLTWATFEHYEARPVDGVPDPHLHAHAFVFNATFDAEERQWKAGQFRDIKRDAGYWEAGFHARFAGRLAEEGFPIQRTAKGWELAGLQPETLAKFSRRTQEIEELAAELGITDADAKGELGAKTRARKQELGRDALRAEWDGRLTPEERETIAAVAGQEVPSRGAGVSAARSMDHAAAKAFERDSVVPERKLMTEALKFGVGSVSVEAIQEEVRRDGILTHEVDGRRLSTTREVLAEERRMLAWARDGRGVSLPLAAGREVRDGRLSGEQRAAVRHVWESTDRVTMVRGAAGVGKTTLMRECADGITESGLQVFTFAPSAKAAHEVLKAEGFEAETLARLLVDKDLQETVKGGVLWIDEAGQISTRQMARLFALAERQDARIVLSGDHKQHGAVERGDCFRLLQTQAGIHAAEVTEVRRQRGEYRDAVLALSKGDIEGGFDRLDGLGFVREVEGSERHRLLAAGYLDAVEEGKTALAIAPTHREGDAVTAEIRRGLKERGRLDVTERKVGVLRSTSLTGAERRDWLSYLPGDTVQLVQNVRGFTRGEKLAVIGHDEENNVLVRRADGEMGPLPLSLADRFQVYKTQQMPVAAGELVRITQNGYTADGKHRLNNGSVYRVKGWTADGDLRLTNGWVVSARTFGHLDYGYCTTSHASQGTTVDRVFIAQGSESFAATDREQFYVSVSRARESCTLLTDDKEALRERVKESGERLSAVEMTAGRGGTGRPDRLRERAAELARSRVRAGKGLDEASDRGRETSAHGHGRETLRGVEHER